MELKGRPRLRPRDQYSAATFSDKSDLQPDLYRNDNLGLLFNCIALFSMPRMPHLSGNTFYSSGPCGVFVYQISIIVFYG